MLWPTGGFNSLKVASNVKVACFVWSRVGARCYLLLHRWVHHQHLGACVGSERTREPGAQRINCSGLPASSKFCGRSNMCVNAAADAVVSHRPIVQLPRSGSKLIYCFVQMSVYSSQATFYRSCFLKGYISSVTCIHNSSKRILQSTDVDGVVCIYI